MQRHGLKRNRVRKSTFIGLVSFLLVCRLPVIAGIGMGEWQLKTPEGNAIDNYSSPYSGFALFMSNGNKYERVNNMERWYFYKQHVIGKQSTGFFIADEKQITVQLFKDKNAWEKELKEEGLNTIIWTRWHSGNWNIFDEDTKFLWLFYGPIVFVISIILVGVSIDVLKKHKLNLRKPGVLGLLGIFLLIAVYCFLQLYPQSL